MIITRNNNNNNFNNNTKMSSDQLWTKVKDATNTARVKNAIFSIETKSEFIEEKGMKVCVYNIFIYLSIIIRTII